LIFMGILFRFTRRICYCIIKAWNTSVDKTSQDHRDHIAECNPQLFTVTWTWINLFGQTRVELLQGGLGISEKHGCVLLDEKRVVYTSVASGE